MLRTPDEEQLRALANVAEQHRYSRPFVVLRQLLRRTLPKQVPHIR